MYTAVEVIAITALVSIAYNEANQALQYIGPGRIIYASTCR